MSVSLPGAEKKWNYCRHRAVVFVMGLCRAGGDNGKVWADRRVERGLGSVVRMSVSRPCSHLGNWSVTPVPAEGSGPRAPPVKSFAPTGLNSKALTGCMRSGSLSERSCENPVQNGFQMWRVFLAAPSVPCLQWNLKPRLCLHVNFWL